MVSSPSHDAAQHKDDAGPSGDVEHAATPPAPAQPEPEAVPAKAAEAADAQPGESKGADTKPAATKKATTKPARPKPREDVQPAKETGPAVIQRYLKTLPSSPGVYRMLDAAGDVIYVGKARSLKARVSNYARLGGHTNRIAKMISLTGTMEFVTTRTESEALLLEANLIKRFRPRFNVLMRDDKSFPYIVITSGHEAPMITKHRGARTGKGDFFGPFASAGAVNRTINTLQRAFLLRTCTDAVYESRTRPCLLYQIKRCAGPCTGEIAPADYAKLVDDARRFLRGQSKVVHAKLKEQMERASEELEFERAAAYRNRLWALAHVTADQNINPEGIEEADVFGAHQEGGQTCIQVFFFRTGQNWGNRAYFPRADRSLGIEEVLESFIAQFYDDKPVPRQVLVSHDVAMADLLGEALSVKAERKTLVVKPARGGKAALVAHAVANAREALGRRLAESATQRRLLEGVAERFGLNAIPRRIEVYDNSHIQGDNAVGAMIVAGPEGFIKNQYRKFNFKSETLTGGDDYAMMREVLTRRFKRLLKDHGEARTPSVAPERAGARADTPDEADTGEASVDLNADLPPWPDLVLIDGGRGQLSVAQEVMADLGVSDITVIGVAKGPDRDAGREHFHRLGSAQPHMLEPRDPVLYFVQRLRDEAHRFAIGSHRAKRKKALGVNPLDEIEGIGPTRKRALLQHFGSAKAVSRAGVDDLKAVSGISAQMAQAIYDFFHDRSS
ncbi:MAG: excinuclease ABC subunit UvrC [Pseudomonadota bacterium]